MKIKNKLLLMGGLLLLFNMWACSIMTVKYSFSGASISPEDKTFAVKYFRNRATIVNPSLSAELTEALKDKLLSGTNLVLTTGGADLNFEGDIVRYTSDPTVASSDEVVDQMRLTVGIKVKYTYPRDSERSYETTFSRYKDYPASSSLQSVESELVEEIIEELVDDIFNKAVANW